MLDSIANAINYLVDKIPLLLFLGIPIGFLTGAYGHTRIRVLFYNDAAVVEYKEWYHFVWQTERVFCQQQGAAGTPAERAVDFAKEQERFSSPAVILYSQKREKKYGGPMIC